MSPVRLAIFRAVCTKRLASTIIGSPTELLAPCAGRFTVHSCSSYSTDGNGRKYTATTMAIRSTLPKVQSLIQDANNLMAPMSQKLLTNGRSMIQHRWNVVSDWYDKFSHTNEVRDAHKLVENLQDKLNDAQQLRRETSKDLTDIRYKLQMCYADLANCQKGDPKYLEIIRKEFEILHQEKQKAEEFALLDKTERDLFMHLQAAVKTSHEKEKIHTNSAKYWSIIGSLIGALLGIVGTAFSYYNRHDLLSDINREFVVIRSDTKTISEQINLLFSEQRKFLQTQETRDRTMLEKVASQNVAARNSQLAKAAQSTNQESWIHWVARTTYVISIYRYFVPKAAGQSANP